MFTKKIVKKTTYDSEVYDCEDCSLGNLKVIVNNALCSTGDAEMRELARENSFATVWKQKIYPRTRSLFYKRLYEALTPHIEALEKLDEEVNSTPSDE